MEWEVVEVETGAHLYVRDTKHSPRSYHLGIFDRVIVPLEGCTLPEVEAELHERIARTNLAGIPVGLLSVVPRDVKVKPLKLPLVKVASAKHTSTHFALKDQVRGRIPYSANWDVVERVPTDQDVFVVLSHFEARGISHFYDQVRNDRRIFALLGGTFPPVHGHKTTCRKPVVVADLRGRPYKEWRDAEVVRLLGLNADARKKVDDLRWSRLWEHYRGAGSFIDSKRALHLIGDSLPENHALRRLFARHAEAMSNVARLPQAERDAVDLLLQETPPAPGHQWEADILVAEIHARYRLLPPEAGGPGLGVFDDAVKCVVWIDYLNPIDRVNP
jgi:hypothetical protein